jgi:site-specific recombinase XerD
VVKRLSQHLKQVHKMYSDEVRARYLSHRVNEDSCEADIDIVTDGPIGRGFAIIQSCSEAGAVPSSDEAENIVMPQLGPSLVDSTSPAENLETFDEQSFLNWLMGPDGGRKIPKSAQQHVKQVKKILEQTDAAGSGKINTLLEKDLIREKFLMTYAVEHNYRPGTIKSHLASLGHFYDFWFLTKRQLTESVKNRLTSLKETTKRWLASYRKDANQSSLEKMDSDLQKIITPSDIIQLHSSEPAKAAVKLLGSAVDISTPLSKAEYTMVRNYLLADVILHNANRPGVLANLTCNDIKSARLIDGHYVVSFGQHKTASTHGPAKIVLPKTLHSWLVIFINSFLPRIGSNDKMDFVFQTGTGQAMDGCMVGRCMQTFWKQAGLRDDITCTLFRKTAVTTVHNNCPDMKGNLDDLMCHRTETANRFYRLVEREKTSVKAAIKLKELLTGHSTAEEVQEQLNTADVEPSSDSEAATDTLPSVIAPSKDSRREKLFSREEVEVLNRCCQNIIRGQAMTKVSITTALNSCLEGRQLLESYSMIQIITRITYERRQARMGLS